MQSNNYQKKSLEKLELSNKPKLIIKKELINKIEWLHRNTGTKEWSGELITTEKNSITDLDNWEITAEDLFLADIGSGAYTEYTTGEGAFKGSDVSQIYDQFPELLTGEKKLQHIHTHHNMKTFFSGTDWTNLEERADLSNYFLMLIVNFDGNWCAKVAFKAKNNSKNKSTLEFSNNMDGYIPLEIDEDVQKETLVVMDCKIIKEETQFNIEEWFTKRYQYILDIKNQEKKDKKKSTIYNGFPDKPLNKSSFDSKSSLVNPNTFQSSLFPEISDTFYDTFSGNSRRENKRISEMTEKEWKEFNNVEIAVPSEFDQRHAKILLNAILDGGVQGAPDPSDCIWKIEKFAKEITAENLDETLFEFSWQLQDQFDALFPEGDDEKYAQLLECVIEYLKPYAKYQVFIRDLIDEIQDEIKVIN